MLSETFRNHSGNQLDELSRAHYERLQLVKSVGAVETPEAIATAMVGECLRFLSHIEQLDISWLDPCVGTGAFALALIDEYVRHLPNPTYSDLPKLTALEVDPEGYELFLKRLESRLSQIGLNIQDYFGSGRLHALQINFFDFFNDFKSTGSTRFDCVLGNPPYVKFSTISEEVRDSLSGLRSWCGKSADLYVYFYAATFELIEEQGVVCFISPHSFFKTETAKEFRKVFSTGIDLRSLVDLGERKIFEKVSVHSGIFVFSKIGFTCDLEYLDLSAVDSKFQVDEIVHGNRQHANVNLTSDAKWIVTIAGQRGMQSENRNPTLHSMGYKIYSGIRTGLTEAYVFDDSNKKFESISNEACVHPLVVATDIRTNRRAAPSKKIINVPKGSANPGEKVINHLEQFRNALENRQEGRSLNYWYEQRPLLYEDKMLKEKIVFPDITLKPHFALSAQGELVADGAFFIDSNDYALLAVLNSSYARTHFETHSPTIGTLSSKGRMRLKKHVVASMPLPIAWISDGGLLEKLREMMNSYLLAGEESHSSTWSQIDSYVQSVYEISE